MKTTVKLGRNNLDTLYTFLFEYRGTTHIDQFYEVNEISIEIVKEWCQRLVDRAEFQDCDDYTILKRESSDEDNGPILMKKFVNIWTMAIPLSSGVGFLYVIKTDSSESESTNLTFSLE